MRKYVAFAFAVAFGLGLSFSLGVSSASESPKAKHTTSEVMKKMHKEVKFHKKLATGTATDADKKLALEYFSSLWYNEPPTGSIESWREKVGGVIAATCQVFLGEEGAAQAFKEANNCKGCHDTHKEKK